MALKSKTSIFLILIGILCKNLTSYKYVLNTFFKKIKFVGHFQIKIYKNTTLKHNGYHTVNNISFL